MLILLAVHVAVAVLASLASRRIGRNVFFVAALAPAATVAWAVLHAPAILAGTPVVETLSWAPDLGLDLRLSIDAFALLMIALVAGMGTLIFLYSRWYFASRPDIGRLAALLVAFAGSMLGLVVTDNLLALFLFWELTSITSYLLIGFDDRTASARASALRALLITATGGLAMLGGIVLLAQDAGTYVLSEMLANPPSGATVDIALLLVLLGAFTKSAQVPFHFWLPGAMAAPTPVSAYLHSATMVKAGVYLIARLSPAFSDVWFWSPLVVGVGLTTMIVGGWRALGQRDLKLLLAHGTTSQLGLLVALFGAGHQSAALAGATLLVAHGAFKAALFMVVGIVDHGAGTRDLTRLNGLHRVLRPTFIVAVIAAASMAGLPPLFGFIAKEGAFEGFIGLTAPWRAVAIIAVVVGSALTFAYSVRFLWGAFASKTADDLTSDSDRVVTTAGRPSWLFLAPAAILSAATVMFGLLPATASDIVVAAAQALDPRAPSYPLALWHGFNVALGLSIVAIAGGLLLWRWRRLVGVVQERFRAPVDGARLHDSAVAGLLRLADGATGLMQTGSLPMYLMVILGTAVVVPGGILLAEVGIPDDWVFVDRPMQFAIVAAMVIATVVAVRSAHRMVAVVAVSVVGYGVAFLFVVQGAPDLALTQLLIETLLLVLFVVVLRHLPRTFATHDAARSQVPRVLVAIGVGLLMTMATLVAASARLDVPVSTEYLARALPEGDGRNVVNVILVDFRAFDTFGEIVVLTVAALGVIGLIRSARRAGDAAGDNATVQMYRPSPILDAAVRALFHTVLLFSVVLLVIGHDRPGGGFIGGLVGGAAFILIYLAGGEPRVRRTEPTSPEILLGAGVTLAALTGAAAWLTGGEFLEAMLFYRELPVIGAIKIGSVFVFDVGVYLVVVGLVMALLRSMGRKEMFAS